VDRGHEHAPDKKDGPEGFAQFVRAIRSALPDLSATIENMIAEGDYVGMWNTATATH
jgi:predicted ester cyclase